MSYSVDLAYIDYYKCAAEGKYSTHGVWDRLRVTAFSSATCAVAGFRALGRIFSVGLEIFKVSFYIFASLFTLGKMGNKERLLAHIKLLGLTLAGFIAQSIQCVVHLVAIAVGVANPKAGYRMMQGGSTPLGLITSQEQKIWQGYRSPATYRIAVRTLNHSIAKLFSSLPHMMRASLKTVMTEFSEAMDSGVVAPLGLMDRFHLFLANPRALTEAQRQMTPIILLNGNFSHQATFLPLLYALKQAGNQRPVFTINLRPNRCAASDVQPTIDAIKRVYGKTEEELLEVDMVGHSMGSDAIQFFVGTDPSIQIRRVVTLGTPWKKRGDLVNQIFDVVASHDILVPERSRLSERHQREVDTGHLGLLFHPESLSCVQEVLS